MELKAKLIHRACASYLATSLPVNFYGLPNGNICLVYSRFYEISFDRSELEFVFALHDEFYYDYEKSLLFIINSEGEKKFVRDEMVDKPEPKIRIIKVARSLNSYNDAQKNLNEMISVIVGSENTSKMEKDFS